MVWNFFGYCISYFFGIGIVSYICVDQKTCHYIWVCGPDSKWERLAHFSFMEKKRHLDLWKWVLCAITMVAIFVLGRGYWKLNLQNLLNRLWTLLSLLIRGCKSLKGSMMSWRREMRGERYLLSGNCRKNLEV